MKTSSGVELPIITSSERADFKRCPKRWYWKWRKGLVPRRRVFGALDFGTWMHVALAKWYLPGTRRNGVLADWFESAAMDDLNNSHKQATEESLEKANELIALGLEMTEAYQLHYGQDKQIRILRTEIPLEYTFSSEKSGPIAAHKLKPDAVFMDQNGDIWLLEHKTAKQVMLEHLVIDDQARPYGAMAEQALRRAGLIAPDQKFRGILYNVLRKALPDLRPQNAKGQYLNKDRVTVSKRQPPPFFVRKRVTMTQKAKKITLTRLRDETISITLKTFELRTREIHPDSIPKTPHKSCAKTCPFFTICVAEENGINIHDMERLMYRQENPYLYHTDTTEDQMGFEIG